jgi:hypothetical protein
MLKWVIAITTAIRLPIFVCFTLVKTVQTVNNCYVYIVVICFLLLFIASYKYNYLPTDYEYL